MSIAPTSTEKGSMDCESRKHMCPLLSGQGGPDVHADKGERYFRQPGHGAPIEQIPQHHLAQSCVQALAGPNKRPVHTQADSRAFPPNLMHAQIPPRRMPREPHPPGGAACLRCSLRKQPPARSALWTGSKTARLPATQPMHAQCPPAGSTGTAPPAERQTGGESAQFVEGRE
jgi:hypothetical protein